MCLFSNHTYSIAPVFRRPRRIDSVPLFQERMSLDERAETHTNNLHLLCVAEVAASGPSPPSLLQAMETFLHDQAEAGADLVEDISHQFEKIVGIDSGEDEHEAQRQAEMLSRQERRQPAEVEEDDSSILWAAELTPEREFHKDQATKAKSQHTQLHLPGSVLSEEQATARRLLRSTSEKEAHKIGCAPVSTLITHHFPGWKAMPLPALL